MSRTDHSAAAAVTAGVAIARARSRLAVGVATTRHDERLRAIFREEIGRCVTQVSVFLLALIQSEGWSIDDLVWSLEPPRNWPFAPGRRLHPFPQAFRDEHDAGMSDPARSGSRSNGGGGILPLKGGAKARLRLLDDTLGVVVRSDRMYFIAEGRHLRIALPNAVPGRVIVACIGRPLSEVLRLPFPTDRDWPIVGVERASASAGSTLVVEVGTSPYVLPWSRPP